jgi:hypothetical protein
MQHVMILGERNASNKAAELDGRTQGMYLRLESLWRASHVRCEMLNEWRFLAFFLG